MCAMNLEVSACSAYKGKTGTVVMLMSLKCRFRRTEKVASPCHNWESV